MPSSSPAPLPTTPTSLFHDAAAKTPSPPGASPATTAPSPAVEYPKRLSELTPALSGKAYYIDARGSTQYDGRLSRPQSALIRGSKTSPFGSTYMINDTRRPSVTSSLPALKPGSSSTYPASRQVRSKHTHLSAFDGTFPEKHYNDRTQGRPSLEGDEEEKLDEYQHQQPRGSIHTGYHVPTSPPSHVLSAYSLSNGGLDRDDDDSTPTARQTFRSLLHLSFGAAPLSLGIFFYTIIIMFYGLLTSPFRLCLKSRQSFSSQLISLLIGPLNVQRKCIYIVPVLATSSRNSSSSRTPLSSDDAIESQNVNIDYSAIPLGKLVSVHLLAPMIALPMTLCAWVMGIVWGLGLVVSDERAGDDRDERRLAQRLVDYWASWLNWGMESKSRSHSVEERRGRRRARPEMTMNSAQ